MRLSPTVTAVARFDGMGHHVQWELEPVHQVVVIDKPSYIADLDRAVRINLVAHRLYMSGA
jgi:hypothetical protein